MEKWKLIIVLEIQRKPVQKSIKEDELNQKRWFWKDEKIDSKSK